MYGKSFGSCFLGLGLYSPRIKVSGKECPRCVNVQFNVSQAVFGLPSSFASKLMISMTKFSLEKSALSTFMPNAACSGESIVMLSAVSPLMFRTMARVTPLPTFRSPCQVPKIFCAFMVVAVKRRKMLNAIMCLIILLVLPSKPNHRQADRLMCR